MVNPFLIILILLGAILMWFILSFAFKPIGKFMNKLLGDAIDIINEEESEEKENE